MDIVNMHYVVNALLFSGIGLAIFVVGFILLELLTPKVNIWKEICEKQNLALSIFLASIMLGIALIIAAGIQG